MDQPQAQAPGPDRPQANADINKPSIGVEVGGTQDVLIDETCGPVARSEQSETPAAPEDAILLDVQPQIEPPTSAKKNAGFSFME